MQAQQQRRCRRFGQLDPGTDFNTLGVGFQGHIQPLLDLGPKPGRTQQQRESQQPTQRSPHAHALSPA